MTTNTQQENIASHATMPQTSNFFTKFLKKSASKKTEALASNNATPSEEYLLKPLMEHIRTGNTEKAIKTLDALPQFVNKPEKKLDFVSVGRFTTPFLVSCTYNNNDILNHILTQDAFKVNYLTQSHCGQQALAHAVVRANQPQDIKEAQTETVKLLINNAKKNLSSDDYKKFLLGGGTWERTALYNSFDVSKNSQAADVILGAIKDAGHIKEAREQVLQLKRPIHFYVHTAKQLDTLLDGLNDTEKKQALLHRDDVGSTVLHWAKTPELANHILKIAPELAIVRDYDNRTPAETTYLAGYKDASNLILEHTDEEKQTIKNDIQQASDKKNIQLALKTCIEAIENNVPVDDAVKATLTQNVSSFRKGTIDFLQSKGVLSTNAPIAQHQDALTPFDHNHQFGIENEFHMPKATEPAIETLLAIFNRELPEKPDKIFTFGQDPEPSVLGNSPDDVSVEINSPILKNAAVAKSFYQICDIAQDLGAEKNATSGIHVHVGCHNQMTKENQGLDGKTDASNAEIQLAFLKTFLQLIQKARPKFDNFCRSQDRQDYPQAWDSPMIKSLDLATTLTPEKDYFNKINSLKDFSEVPGFTLQIGREKYVLVALPKDSKGTLEIRELKNNITNDVGMNNDEIKNIFNFVRNVSNLTTKILQDNPPQAGEIYKPSVGNYSGDIDSLANNFSMGLHNILEKTLANKTTVLKREQQITTLNRLIKNSIFSTYGV